MTLWGGRFTEGPDRATWDFTVSRADRRLLAVDVQGSLAHVAGLAAAGLVAPEQEPALTAGLEQILEEARAGRFEWQEGDEDVHSAVERRLDEIAGPVAGSLRTGRSRNDQIALDLRLWMRGATGEARSGIAAMVRALIAAAGRAGETVVPCHTHLQQAQAVPLAHVLLAHAWPLLRDADRFREGLARIAVSPLGASAGGGSRLPLDPAVPARVLGLSGVFDNSLDAVAARDASSEYMFCAARTLIDLSRLAEEIVLWASGEFGWMVPSDRHATGSSILPHKRNPDTAELVRAKAASGVGHLAAALAIEKGLPHSYGRDLQQAQEHLFALHDDLIGSLTALAGLVEGACFDPPPTSAAVTALDLAEVLVERGVPIRDAHHAVGRLVGFLEAQGRDLGGLTAPDLAAAHPAFAPDDVALTDPVASVRARSSPGGGSFASVEDQVARINRLLEDLPTLPE
jgi:argininosuccinate lyase